MAEQAKAPAKPRDDKETKEAEYAALAQKLRSMQNAKDAYTQEVTNIVVKQNADISRLKKDNDEMGLKLSLAYSPAKLAVDLAATQQLAALLEGQEAYWTLIRSEEGRIAEIDKQIDRVMKHLDEQRKIVGPEEEQRERSIQAARHIRILEDRLHKMTTDFNRQLAENAKSREAIQLLLYMRLVFKNLYRRLVDKLQSFKKKVGDESREAQSNYEIRTEAVNKMKTLKERAMKEDAAHASEMKLLQRLIAHDTSLMDFMVTKDNDRTAYKLEEHVKKSKISKREKALSEEQKAYHEFQRLITMVRIATGLESTERAASDFANREDGNFARFDYVSELNDDVSRLRDEIAHWEDKVRQMSDQVSTQHRSVVDASNLYQLKARNDALTKQRNELAAENEGCLKQIKDACESMAAMFKGIGCHDDSMKRMLGYEDGVSPSNVMTILSMIEERAYELKGLQLFLEKNKVQAQTQASAHWMTVKRRSVAVTNKLAADPSRTLVPNVIFPQITDETTDLTGDDAQGPLDLDALAQRAAKKISKKEAAGLLTLPFFSKSLKRPKTGTAKKGKGNHLSLTVPASDTPYPTGSLSCTNRHSLPVKTHRRSDSLDYKGLRANSAP